MFDVEVHVIRSDANRRIYIWNYSTLSAKLAEVEGSAENAYRTYRHGEEINDRERDVNVEPKGERDGEHIQLVVVDIEYALYFELLPKTMRIELLSKHLDRLDALAECILDAVRQPSVFFNSNGTLDKQVVLSLDPVRPSDIDRVMKCPKLSEFNDGRAIILDTLHRVAAPPGDGPVSSVTLRFGRLGLREGVVRLLAA
jgi:hypothetical protein